MTNPKILLVDDVELFLEMLKDVFRRESFTLLTAKGGWQALDIMGREKPDLVFMDYFMPHGRGDEACARAKADPGLSTIPIVIVTNRTNQEDLSSCWAAGCDDILFKPIDREQVLQAAFRYLGRASAVSTRSRVRIPVRFGQDPASLSKAWSFDLAPGGLFVETVDIPALGAEVHLEMTLPSPVVTLTGKARVVRANLPGALQKGMHPKGVALQFLEFSPTHLEMFNAFLRRLKTEGRAPKGTPRGSLPEKGAEEGLRSSDSSQSPPS